MTKFEKALINELKGIRKELQKMNRVKDESTPQSAFKPLAASTFKSET